MDLDTRLRTAREHAQEHLDAVMAEIKSEAMYRKGAGVPEAQIERDLGVTRKTIRKWWNEL